MVYYSSTLLKHKILLKFNFLEVKKNMNDPSSDNVPAVQGLPAIYLVLLTVASSILTENAIISSVVCLLTPPPPPPPLCTQEVNITA